VTIAAARRRPDGDESPQSASATGPFNSVVKSIRFAWTFEANKLVEPGLEDRDLAPVQRRNLLSSLSTQVTWWPKSAKQAPETSPT